MSIEQKCNFALYYTEEFPQETSVYNLSVVSTSQKSSTNEKMYNLKHQMIKMIDDWWNDWSSQKLQYIFVSLKLEVAIRDLCSAWVSNFVFPADRWQKLSLKWLTAPSLLFCRVSACATVYPTHIPLSHCLQCPFSVLHIAVQIK